MTQNRPFLLAVLLLAPLATLHAADAPNSRFVADTAVVLTDRADPILAYAADGLCGFLRKTTSMDVRQQEAERHRRCWLFRLAVDSSLCPAEFWVTCDQPSGSRLMVKLTGHDATGLPCEVRMVGTDILMRIVSGGEFELGSDRFANAQPVHQVRVEPFYLARSIPEDTVSILKPTEENRK